MGFFLQQQTLMYSAFEQWKKFALQISGGLPHIQASSAEAVNSQTGHVFPVRGQCDRELGLHTDTHEERRVYWRYVLFYPQTTFWAQSYFHFCAVLGKILPNKNAFQWISLRGAWGLGVSAAGYSGVSISGSRWGWVQGVSTSGSGDVVDPLSHTPFATPLFATPPSSPTPSPILSYHPL